MSLFNILSNCSIENGLPPNILTKTVEIRADGVEIRFEESRRQQKIPLDGSHLIAVTKSNACTKLYERHATPHRHMRTVRSSIKDLLSECRALGLS